MRLSYFAVLLNVTLMLYIFPRFFSQVEGVGEKIILIYKLSVGIKRNNFSLSRTRIKCLYISSTLVRNFKVK